MAESHPSTKSFTVAIIGGGLGGVLLAISLSNRNLPFHIYESASNFTETSAGLGFGPNAVRTMAKLDPRIYDAYAALKTENKQDNKKDTWFDFWLGHGDLEQVGELKMGSLGGGNVLRASFLLEMAKLLPEGCVTFGKKLLEVEETNGYAILRFADGTSTDADVVVGCDGIRSKVRESLLGKDHEAGKPVFVGVYLYRGVVKMESAIAAVGEYFAQNSQVYMGRDRNIATYPIENGTMLNVVAYRKQKEETWEHERWVVESSRDKMIEDFGDFHESIQKLLQLLDPNIWALFDMPPIESYSFGHITLLGDAAHASTPHCGAGAGMAVEDAFILSELFSDTCVTQRDIPAALAAYDGVRRPRTQRLVQYSRESGMMFQMRHPGIQDDIERIKEELITRQQWIWDLDLDEHLEDARNELYKALRR